MIPEPGQINLNFTNFIILLGVVQGILLSFTGLASKKVSGRIRGVLFFLITCIMTEFFLNRSGYMYRVIALVDFSEPLQFAIPPLVYLGVLSLDSEADLKGWQFHFIPFILYLIYFLPFYFAPADYKFESYYFTHHLKDIHFQSEYRFYLRYGSFRNFQMQIFYIQTTIYLIFTFQRIRNLKLSAQKLSQVHSLAIGWWFIFSILIALLVVVVIAVKILFVRDLGDHIIAFFLTFILYMSSIAEMIGPAAFKSARKEELSRVARSESSSSGLDEIRMSEIFQKLLRLMESDHLYRDNLISLQKLAKSVGEPGYIVSKVINEKSGYTFFDWIAYLRVEEAKRLLTDGPARNFTIEQIAEEVGYNSKSAFNKAFKKFTGTTPSEFRNVM